MDRMILESKNKNTRKQQRYERGIRPHTRNLRGLPGTPTVLTAHNGRKQRNTEGGETVREREERVSGATGGVE
jgi:hypothetical protein